jgi:hypothetical protein
MIPSRAVEAAAVHKRNGVNMLRNSPLKPGIAFNVALSAFLLWVLVMVGNYALNRPVSFDGAMNLQVAQSLSDGEGYVRHYGGTRAFPIEVQTNAPFIVPAAAVFKLFGVGMVQSQLVNFAYMALFLVLVGYVLTRFFSLGIALAGALGCFLVPGFYQIGMNGWGELIAFFWWLAGTYLLLGDPDQRSNTRRMVLGGLCLGLALATKTILLIGLAATLGVFGLWQLYSNRRALGTGVRHVALAVAALMLPILAIEAWRWIGLGGTPEYVAWWGNQAGAIQWQAGATSANTAVVGTGKALGHFTVLVGLLGLPALVVATWLFLPILVSAYALGSAPLQTHARRVWAALLLVAGIYLAWWLLVTPDSHTRLRRIFNGLLAVQLVWFFVFGWARERLVQRGRNGMGHTALLAATLIVALGAQAALAYDFAKDLKAHPRADLARFNHVLDVVRSLPPDAKLFGKGFLSAPGVALYSGRDLDDIDHYTADDLAAIGVGYLVLDPPAAQAHRFSPELRRYEHSTLVFDLGYEVHAADFRRKRDPFTKADHDAASTVPAVDFTKMRYSFVYGMQGAGRDGWRWATTDAEVLLRHQDQHALDHAEYKPNKPYLKDRPLTLRLAVDGCTIGARSIATSGKQTLYFNIPDTCRVPRGENVRVQIVADNMLRPVARDLKQMSYVMLAVGFADRPAPGTAR